MTARIRALAPQVFSGRIAAMVQRTPRQVADCTGDKLEGRAKQGQHNAVWVESIYFRGYDPKKPRRVLKERDVRKLAATLLDNGMRYAYVFAGPYGDDGSLPAYACSDTAQDSVRRLRKLAPDLVILPWLGGLQHKTVHLENPAWVARAIDDTVRLIDTLRVPGVHLDFEFILPQSEFVLNEQGMSSTSNGLADYGTWHVAFHRRLRERLPDAFVSSVIPATATATRPWKRKHDVEEAARLAAQVDQLVLLYYDTAIDDGEVFAAGLNEQLRHIAAWKDRPGGARLECLIAAGTFVNAHPLRKYRHLEVENLPGHFSALLRAIEDVQRDARLVDGAAVFCDWETRPWQWRQFRQWWVDGPR